MVEFVSIYIQWAISDLDVRNNHDARNTLKDGSHCQIQITVGETLMFEFRREDLVLRMVLLP